MSELAIIAGAVVAIVILAALAALAFVVDNRVGQALEAYDRRSRALERNGEAIGNGVMACGGQIAGAVNQASYNDLQGRREGLVR